jgi:hypothetical protein
MKGGQDWPSLGMWRKRDRGCCDDVLGALFPSAPGHDAKPLVAIIIEGQPRNRLADGERVARKVATVLKRLEECLQLFIIAAGPSTGSAVDGQLMTLINGLHRDWTSINPMEIRNSSAFAAAAFAVCGSGCGQPSSGMPFGVKRWPTSS